MRDWVRRLLGDRLGVPGRAVMAWRTRAQAERLLARRGLAAPASRLAASLGDRVLHGPFRGMHYPRRRGDIVHLAKLLGSYELELFPALERLIARGPTRIVNIGSGDGYYAVGLARRLPSAAVIAVDPDPIAQRACASTAALNGVRTVERRTRLDVTALEELLRSADFRAPGAQARTLLVVDCEGFEDDLLDPVRAPSLAHADLVVETHDFARLGVTARLAARFGASHRVEGITVAPRDPALYPELASLPVGIAMGLLDEFRHQPQSWLVLTQLDAAA